MIAHKPDVIARGDSKRILIVDDNSKVRSIVRQQLEKELGFICLEAANGLDAMRAARKKKPDLVIMDLAMPVMNGFEAAVALRREMPEIPVVLLTIYNELGVMARTTCVKAILGKTDGIAELLKCVQSLLNKNSEDPLASTVHSRSVSN